MAAESTTIETAVKAAQTAIPEDFKASAYKALAALIEKVTSGASQATDFLVAQVPDVIRQLLVYNLVTSLVVFSIAVLIGIALPIIARKVYKHFAPGLVKSHTYDFDRQNLGWVLSIATGFGDFIAILVACSHTEWIKIWLAPKIWLIEYAADLLKKASGH